MKKHISKPLTLLLALLVLTALTSCSGGTADRSVPIRIGSKDFTENRIVAEIYALALEDAGYNVMRKFDLSLATSVLHTAIVNDEIDLYPEYTGTALLSILKHDMVTDPDETYNIVKEEYADTFHLVCLNYAPANDGEGIAITKKASDAYGIKTLSDLQANADKIRFASIGEFDVKKSGLPALTAAYGAFSWKSSHVYSNASKYTLLANDEADATSAFTTEGYLANPQIVLLEDDLRAWPPYNLVPIVRQEILDLYPDIADILNDVDADLTTEVLIQLNAKVDLDGEDYKTVARDYLKK